MSNMKDGQSGTEVESLDLPEDFKLRQQQSSSNGGGRKWLIIAAVVALVVMLGLWQLMSSSGPSASTDTHPTTTFGK